MVVLLHVLFKLRKDCKTGGSSVPQVSCFRASRSTGWHFFAFAICIGHPWCGEGSTLPPTNMAPDRGVPLEGKRSSVRRVWLKIKQEGLRRFWSIPLPRATHLPFFWSHSFRVAFGWRQGRRVPRCRVGVQVEQPDLEEKLSLFRFEVEKIRQFLVRPGRGGGLAGGQTNRRLPRKGPIGIRCGPKKKVGFRRVALENQPKKGSLKDIHPNGLLWFILGAGFNSGQLKREGMWE